MRSKDSRPVRRGADGEVRALRVTRRRPTQQYDPAERLCFGLVCGQVEELGYFSLGELRAVRGPLGLRIERDLWWRPAPLSQVRSGQVR